jgi:membrane protein
MKLSSILAALKPAAVAWVDDKAQRLGAALAYYSVFSLAPLLVLALAVAARIYGEEAARGQLEQQLQNQVGPDVAAALQSLLAHSQGPGKGVVATTLSVVALVFGASGMFAQLQDALNTIWKVESRPGRGLWGFARDHFIPFLIVLAAGGLLLASLVLATALEALRTYLPTPGLEVWRWVNQAAGFLFLVLVFGLVYKVLPDVRLPWRDVWPGAVLTAVLFTVGKYLLDLYLGQASVTSGYGAAGSLVVVLLWVYYSSQILLFGAEYTRAVALARGSSVVPAANARFVTAGGSPP